MAYRQMSFWRIPDLQKGFYHEQIMQFITEHIETGRLPVHARLPAYRKIADENKLHRHTMLRALRRLKNLGYLSALRGSQMCVSPDFPGREALRKLQDVQEPSFPIPQFSIPHPRYAVPDHKFLSVGFDVPSPAFFPHKLYKKYLRRAVEEFDQQNQMNLVIDYRGSEYKNSILNYLSNNRGFRIAPDSLHIIMERRNCLLGMLSSVLPPGSVMINTCPKDVLLHNVVEELGIRAVYLSTVCDSFLSDLRAFLKTNAIGALYLRPQCGYPEGNFLDADLCQEILHLAREYEFFILEEEEEQEFWHRPEPYEPLFFRGQDGLVLYMGALSLLIPYMRATRIVVGPPKFMERLKTVALFPMETRDIIQEKVIAAMLDSGEFYDHLVRIQDIITNKHFDQLKWQLTNYLGEFVTISNPAAGLSLWVTWQTAKQLEEDMKALQSAGFQIPFMPWSPAPGEEIRHMRLGFGSWDILEAQGPAKMIQDKHETGN